VAALAEADGIRNGGIVIVTGQDPAGTAPPDNRKLNTNVPHPARVYDYWLGGKDNFPADRRAAEAVLAANPAVRLTVVENRAFLRRVVRFLARQGIRQFLDLGTGLPTSPNVHEVAHQLAPDARVVYVDNEAAMCCQAQRPCQLEPAGNLSDDSSV
jgi:S-adenosyl methyltransferase